MHQIPAIEKESAAKMDGVAMARGLVTTPRSQCIGRERTDWQGVFSGESKAANIAHRLSSFDVSRRLEDRRTIGRSAIC